MENDRARKEAKAQLESIREKLEVLKSIEKNGPLVTEYGDLLDREGAEEDLRNLALSIQVRGDWHIPGEEEGKKEISDVQALLCFGGPAVRIRARMDDRRCLCSAKLQYQDWFTSWEACSLSKEDEKLLMEFLGYFYLET